MLFRYLFPKKRALKLEQQWKGFPVKEVAGKAWEQKKELRVVEINGKSVGFGIAINKNRINIAVNLSPEEARSFFETKPSPRYLLEQAIVDEIITKDPYGKLSSLYW